MGGEWGVGAALAFETLPAEGRRFSGLLQEGYVVGSLLAAALYWLLFPHLHGTGMFVGWRVMFMIGALPALLAFYLRSRWRIRPGLAGGEAAPDGGWIEPARFASDLKGLVTDGFFFFFFFFFFFVRSYCSHMRSIFRAVNGTLYSSLALPRRCRPGTRTVARGEKH